MSNSRNCCNQHKATKCTISKPILILIKMFNFMGLSAFSETELRTRYQKIYHIKWSLIYLIVFSMAYFLIFYHHRELFFVGDNFGYFHDFIKVFVFGASHLITLIETLWTQQHSTEFFHVYSSLHEQWANVKQTKRELQIYKRLLSLILFYVVVLFAIEMNYLFEIQHKKKWINFYITYMPSVVICRFRMLQVSMCLFLIMTELLQCNDEILEVATATQTHYTEDVIYAKLSLFMRKYQQIYMMMELFKKSYSMSTLFIFIKSYVKILSDIYWAYWILYNQNDVYELAEYSLVIPTALNILLTLIISKDCMSAAKLIPNSLHSLRHSIENLKLSHKIQNFSLQLKHQQIIFDAYGCFTVDCYIVSGVLGSIATYMIFYTEFMPKFEHL